MNNHKKICAKCGKIINYSEKCKCSGRKVIGAKPRIRKDNRFYSTYKWQKLRKSIVKRDKGLCQRCLSKGIIETNKLEVHHIKSREHYPELEYDKDNLITVCKTCNLELSTNDTLDFEWKNPEQDNELMIL